MKKAALLLLAVAILGAAPALAQTVLATRTHGATVTIPDMAFIRFTMGASDADVAAPDPVEFIFNSATYDVGTFSPTNASFNWDDIKVFYNGGSDWQVVVSTVGSTGFDWTKIAIKPTVADPYDLGNTSIIESDTGKTMGWRSLGIDPADYLITFDGTEDPATYTATVTFTLQNP
jgi:hypothetical protein